MSNVFTSEMIEPLRASLDQHPVYRAVKTLDDLRCFMEHHVYSVWDFMSLVKFLQNHLAPAAVPWLPKGDAMVRRFINELVLEEESDQGLPDAEGKDTYSSHFELYCQAMRDIGADATKALQFIEQVQQQDIHIALTIAPIPEPARQFSQATFNLLATKQPHLIGAALAIGREQIIPTMFRRLLDEMALTEWQAPTFYYYLERHVHLDDELHGPLSLRLLDHLCQDDEQRIAEARQAAYQAVNSRIAFWDGVLKALEQRQQAESLG